MAKVGATRAAELTGKSKSTIQRAMDSGKLSFERDANGRRVIDPSELDRVYGLLQMQLGNPAPADGNADAEKVFNAEQIIEMERYKMRVEMLEKQLEAMQEQLEDMREQRNDWQKQAQQVLITSQYSQQQAEELKRKIQLREKKEEEKKQQALHEKMIKLQSQKAENGKAGSVSGQGATSSGGNASGAAAGSSAPRTNVGDRNAANTSSKYRGNGQIPGQKSQPQQTYKQQQSQGQQALKRRPASYQNMVSGTNTGNAKPYQQPQKIIQPANEGLWAKIKRKITA